MLFMRLLLTRRLTLAAICSTFRACILYRRYSYFCHMRGQFTCMCGLSNTWTGTRNCLCTDHVPRVNPWSIWICYTALPPIFVTHRSNAWAYLRIVSANVILSRLALTAHIRNPLTWLEFGVLNRWAITCFRRWHRRSIWYLCQSGRILFFRRPCGPQVAAYCL